MKKYSFNRNELAGSIGDLGLFVPIVAALILINGMNATVIFLAAGLLYILAGLYFNIPMPVQPFKAVATIAIALHLEPRIIASAGILMGFILGLIAITPLSKYLVKIFTKPIVRGVQLVIGLFLIKSGISLIANTNFFIMKNVGVKNISINMLLVVMTFAILLLFKNNKKIPASLVTIIFGLVIGFFAGGFQQLSTFSFGPERFSLIIPSLKDFSTAFVLLVIPQLPMTLANSVVATADTSKIYFGEKAEKVTEKKLLFSLSAANIVFGLLGSMPLCHGSSGQTAHYKFGSRTAGSNIIIGSMFIVLALFFGKFAVSIFSTIPAAIYGSLLIYLGIYHALLIRDIAQRVHYITPATMLSISFATSNLTLALAVGCLVELAIFATKRLTKNGKVALRQS